MFKSDLKQPMMICFASKKSRKGKVASQASSMEEVFAFCIPNQHASTDGIGPQEWSQVPWTQELDLDELRVTTRKISKEYATRCT